VSVDVIYKSKGALIAFLEDQGFSTGGGAGISGTPADNEVAVWTNSTTIEGDSNFTWDGSTLDVGGALTVDGNTTLGDASGDTVTINAQTIDLANVAAGTDNTVLVYNGSTVLTDEIDSRVWGSTLVDGTNGTDNELAIFTDSNSVEGDSNLTWDGSTLDIGGALTVDGNATLGDASGDSVTINAQTIVLANVDTGTDNTVLVYDGSSIVTDEIDSKVWAGALVDYTGTPSNNQVAIWTDTDTLEGDSGLTFDGTALTMLTSSATIAQTRLLEYTDGTDAMTVLSDGGISLATGNRSSPSVQTTYMESDGDGEWTKIMSHGALSNYWAPCVVALVTLNPMGYSAAGLGEHYEFIVTARWSRNATAGSTYAAHTDITVQPLNNAALNGWDPTTDIILTYNGITAAEIWIKGLSDWTSCEVSILGGHPGTPTGYSANTWEIQAVRTSTWATFSSLGADVYGTWAPGQDSATSVFSAYGNADQALAAATWTTIEFNTENYDVGGDFNTTTDTFTAPTTGKYMLSTQVRLSSVDSSSSQYVWIKIITSNRTYFHLNGVRYRGGGAYSTPSLCVVADMDASDTAYVQILVQVGTSTTQGSGAANYTAFQGCLIG